MSASLLDDLAEYVDVVSTSMNKTRRAEDPPAYVRHLATAALNRLFATTINPVLR
jgi:hypothetical protein